MGRKSIAEKILERYEAENVDDPRLGLEKLVVYDFEGRRIAKEFFLNLRRLLQKVGGFRVQYSVVSVRDMRGAKAVEELARHYGCKDVRIYAAEGLG